MQRADRQYSLGLTPYGAFQSSIELRARMEARDRDLKNAANELESLRFDQKRTRASLNDALATMEGGFALFSEGRLLVCNDLFRGLLPDISDKITPNLALSDYLRMMETSPHVKSTNRPLSMVDAALASEVPGLSVFSLVLELGYDRWYQLRVQRKSAERTILLLTEISTIVRQNRNEKEHLIDAQATYLQAAFENMRSGVCTFSEAGEVLMFNAMFANLLGLSPGRLHKGAALDDLLEVMSQSGVISHSVLSRLVAWRERMPTSGLLRTRLEKGENEVLDLQVNALPGGGLLFELKDITLESRTTSALEKWVLRRTADLTDANAKLVAQYEEQARVEEELRKAKEQAEAAVASKTRFLAAASHDLLQPVNAAKLMIDALIEDTADSEHSYSIRRLRRAFNSTEQILHSLLDLSRLDSAASDTLRAREVFLGDIMLAVFQDQQGLALQKGVELRMVSSSCHVMTDPTYILRSLQNLVVNAIQYNRPGGRVLVGCRRRGRKLVLQVWDSGPGIAKADQVRIFKEFTRGAAGGAAGVGLGLSVVERTCRHLKHALTLRSEPDQGAVFSIEMNRASVVEDHIEWPTRQTIGGPLPRGAIAVVIENDEDVLFATTRLLESWDVDVLAARSVEEALDLVQDIGMAPDVILADYRLDHGQSGVDAIVAIIDQTGTRVPAIVLTANRDEELLANAWIHGFTVMSKPVNTVRLKSLLHMRLRHLEQRDVP